MRTTKVCAGHRWRRSVSAPASPSAPYTARTYYDEYTVTSSDGLLTLKLKPIKQMKSVDANGAEVVQIYAEPTEGAGP